MKRIIYLLLLLIIPFKAFAEKEKQIIPRFATIKSAEANVRKGPGVQYPAIFVYQYKGLPIEIIGEYEQWRKIKDIKGDEGWIHSSILSGKRGVILNSKDEQFLYKSNNLRSRVIAKLMPNLVCSLNKCIKSWCKIKCENNTGWVSRGGVWGVHENEFQ